ncbi:MAG: primosomal protein N' [Clostridiales bacterium]|nr:primosomal protein N' [Clostridiales bacterium]
MIAQVIVDIAHSEVDKIFDYKTGDTEYQIGSRVEVPFGYQKIEGFIIGFKEKSDFPESKIKEIIRCLDDFPALTLECLTLAQFLKDTYHVPFALALRQFIPAELRGGRVKEKTLSFVTLTEGISPIEMVASLRKGSTAQANLIGYLSKEGKTSLTVLNEKFGSAVKSLKEKGFVTVTQEKAGRIPYKELDAFSKDVKLSKEQQDAIESFKNTQKTVTLLYGVTGSGKTEVYLRLINSTLKEGKTAIMLVPEIALTPQMLRQLRARFGDSVSILHSGLSKGERYDEWLRLKTGEAKIAIGARSAIFAPLENLGLIIIDEEHDGSYEAETAPRYKTLEVAKKRAELSGSKIIIGSATPSIESYDKALSGEYNLAKMSTRINGKDLPEFIVADMRGELRRGNESVFSADLKDALKECVEKDSQAIIFFNRRGYSQQVICRDCGFVAKCQNCDVTLNYHRDTGVLKCHYCGSAYKMLSACPECGSVNLSYSGAGTQKIVAELRKLFPNEEILRMDNDTTSNKEGHFKILKQFAERKARFLVGTQMVAKGHDFPSVTLVGILDADMSLYFSDYRSAERTFQLITQVAGRSGRADKKGKVILQTYNPDNLILSQAINYDYEGFFKNERAIRRATGFPPYALVLRVMIESNEDGEAMNALKEVYGEIKEIYDKNRDNFLFFNKMRSPVKKINGKYRYQALMRICGDYQKIKDQIYEKSLSKKTAKVLIYVEENPSNLY